MILLDLGIGFLLLWVFINIAFVFCSSKEVKKRTTDVQKECKIIDVKNIWDDIITEIDNP